MTTAYRLDSAGYLVGEIMLDGGLNTMARPDLILVTPPAPLPGMARRWTAGAWTLEADLRGRVYVRPDGGVVAITEIGQSPPTDAVDQFSAEGVLRSARAAKWSEAKALRDAVCLQPIDVGGHVFDADAVSQTRVAGAVQLATLANGDWSIDWTLADNSTATLSRADVVALGVAIGQRTSAAHAAARALRTQILAATSFADLAAITITI